MLSFPFMQHAFIGCFIVSLLAGPIGWFMLLRRQAFAAHALPHIGFSGAAASILFGFPPLLGMLGSSILAGLFMAHDHQGEKNTFSPIRRETMTGLVLAASLGIGVWCLHMANGASNQATTLLFGDVLGLNPTTLYALTGVFVLCTSMLSLIGRPLLYSSIAPELAEARGVPLQRISRLFMILAALATAACSEVAGALLSFSLMIGPAAAALRLELSPARGICFSIVTALFLSWSGLIFSWYTDAPVAFWIGTEAIILYALSSLFQRWRARR